MRHTLRELVEAIRSEKTGVDWQESPCPLCRGRSWDVLVEGPDQGEGAIGLWFAIVKCRDCGLCFTNPRPSPESIGQFYADNYHAHREHRTHRRGLRARWKEWWQTRDERHVLPARTGRLLDVGCGRGEFLLRMRRQGWQVTGLDFVPDVVQRLRVVLGLPALVGSLPHPDLEPGSFDLVTMWHVLEHVHEPLEMLREARRLLARGGRLVVAVPNIDSLAFRWFGPYYYGLDLPRHLTHFSAVTLQAMLKVAGFHVHEMRPQWHSHWLRASVRLAQRAGNLQPWQRWLQYRKPSMLATCYGALVGQSDCLLATAIA